MHETMFSLGARLEACAGFVRDGSVVADIGTDHAYLPIWLVLSGKINLAYASDINDQPIKSAIANIKRYNLNDKIIAFTANGLNKDPHSKANDIVIAGMGGDNIAGILDDAQWVKASSYRLILQPMSRTERLREYLYRNNFEITTEKPICEANRIYTVICAEYRSTHIHFDEFDFYVGMLGNQNEYSVKLIEKQAGILKSVADGMMAKGDLENESHLRKLSEKLYAYAKGDDI